MSKIQQASKGRKTTFTCNAPTAEAVALAGDFNQWDTKATPMSKVQNGTWQIKLVLAPGRHEFKYVIDGRWCCEPGKDDHCCELETSTVENPFGTRNRIVNVT